MTDSEQQVFFAVLRSAVWQREMETAVLRETFSWEGVVDALDKHKLLAVAADAIMSLPDGMLPPKELQQRTMQCVSGTVRSHYRLNAVVCEVFTRLQEAGFHPVLLKGQGLSQIYPMQCVRSCGDIDIFIGKHDFWRACDIVNELPPKPPVRGDVCAAQGSSVERQEELTIHWSAMKDDIDIEVHQVIADTAIPCIKKEYNEWAEKRISLKTSPGPSQGGETQRTSNTSPTTIETSPDPSQGGGTQRTSNTSPTTIETSPDPSQGGETQRTSNTSPTAIKTSPDPSQGGGTQRRGERDMVNINGMEIAVPGKFFNSIYVFEHLLKHLRVEGVGFRQFIDWMVVLDKAIGDGLSETQREWMEEALTRFHLMDAWQVLGGILVWQLGMDKSRFPFWNERKARYSQGRNLQYIVDAGNLGHDTAESKGYYFMEPSMRRNLLALRYYWRHIIFEYHVFPYDTVQRTIKRIWGKL